MKKYLILIVLLLLIIEVKAKSFYTIIDDDASSAESITTIKNICDNKDIKISFAVIARNLQLNKEVKDSLISFQKQGFHICNHSLTHSKDVWNEGNYALINAELKDSQHILDSLGFVNNNYFVYPYGRFSEEKYLKILPYIKEHNYKLAFNSRGDECNKDDFNKFYINRFPIRRHENISVVKYKIDRAIENNSWIVFLTHSAMSRDFSSEYLSEVIDYCKERNLPCLTVDEAYKYISQKGENNKIHEWRNIDELYLLVEMHIIYILAMLLVVTVIVAIFIYRRRRAENNP